MNLELPMHYDLIDQHERINGADGQRFFNNLRGLILGVPSANRALKAIGINTNRLWGVVRMGYGAAYMKFGTAAVIVGGVVGGALAVGAFAALWNIRMFY
ncbi:hypothetical protein [Erysipelothrix aquatica]|uniref:hypothetical protein n=1 Tax=Erysipelothrix aquatica TaxID=2683714 RepID=UPI00135BA74F|nr:hypothetical protein [Erysipelothrix aquatica]